jgi:hypothetical protein
MSSNNANLRIDGLDFDAIKTNLKDYLRTQDQFKDFDFEGSSMNILLDILAYNTHYQAFYANMVANEAFLDSAVLRPSAVSIAKHLGYTPRSTKSSKIEVDIQFKPSVLDSAIKGNAFINRGDIFRGKLGNTTYNFIPLESYKIQVVSNTPVVKSVKLYEGTLKNYNFVVNSFDPTQKFVLPSNKIDVDTLSVRVQESTTNTSGLANLWFKATDLNGLNGESLAYFLQETEDGRFEIYFGDGILGKKLRNGNVIVVEYVQTNGVEANGCSNFTFSSGANSLIIGGVLSITPVLNDYNKSGVSYGGTDPESIESIKYYAPRNYQAQERAVTEEDYKTILVREFSDGIDSFLVWGGEQNDPPSYGKVFISIKPKNGKRISTLEKLALERSVLSKKNLVGITPEIVDPDFLFLEVASESYYDLNKTNLSPDGLAAFILQTIRTFESDNLSKFGKNFKMSKFLYAVDNTNQSISGSRVVLKLNKRIEPLLSYSAPYTINFDNPLLHPIDGYQPILSSTQFGVKDTTSPLIIKPTVDAYLDDDGRGNVRTYKVVGTEKVYINSKQGKIDYATGKVVLNNFKVEYIKPSTESEIKIAVVPATQDISARRNQIIMFDYDNSNVEVVPESTYGQNSRTATPFPY